MWLIFLLWLCGRGREHPKPQGLSEWVRAFTLAFVIIGALILIGRYA